MKAKRDEYYTPVALVEAARYTLGWIDYDPASCEEANRTVKADRYATIADPVDLPIPDDAFRIFCNPPYSNPAPFLDKTLMALYSNVNISALLLLNNSVVDAAYFHRSCNRKTYRDWHMCLLKGRTSFTAPGGAVRSQNRCGQVMILVSRTKTVIDRFYMHFSALGIIVMPRADASRLWY